MKITLKLLKNISTLFSQKLKHTYAYNRTFTCTTLDLNVVMRINLNLGNINVTINYSSLYCI